MRIKALTTIAALTLSGCSSYQMNQLGFRSSPVNVYPNYMDTIELCEVANGYRPTNQTIVSVGSEQSKRGLTHDRCDELVKELYFSRFIKSIKITRPEIPAEPVPTPLPAKPLPKPEAKPQ
jgi:hypothetical protein